MSSAYFNKSIEEVCASLRTDQKNGLVSVEAERRLREYGFNEVPKVKKSIFKVYLAPLFNWLIVIYLLATLFMIVVSFLGFESNMTIIYSTLVIVFINCLVAIIQQYRATKKLNALRELSAPTSTVIRDGKKMEVPSKEIVVGDLLALSQGDKIAADARIIESTNMLVNESSLTGESEPVRKLEKGDALNEPDIPIGDRANMVFFGTFIATGNGRAITVDTGANTEIGKISHKMEEAGTSDIPIRKKMNNFGKWLGLLVIVFWLTIVIAKGIATGQLEFITSLNSAMDIMPINIPLLTVIVLITGVLYMAKKGVIIRNLASVDSLGRVSVVCSDKTGTLTKNQMSIQHVWVNGSHFKVTGSGYEPEGNIILMKDPKNPKYVKNIEKYPQLKLLLTAGFLNNNSALIKKEISTTGKEEFFKWDIVGSPTEGALMVLFQKGMGDYNLDEEFSSEREYPFDSAIKRMTKIYKRGDKHYSFTKGATEILLPLCSKVIYRDNEVAFTEDIKSDILENANKYEQMGYRILSLSYKKLDFLPDSSDEGRIQCESDMIYIGFVTILDPPREGVKQSVEQCHSAGVDVVMITGDSPATARAVASQIAIVSEGDTVLEGSQINAVKDYNKFKRIKVFARVSPEHKQDIVKKYKDEKKVVAMTGDGVNDALALNMADAGVAMGIQGTDVAKEASDMVISDDSFNSIVYGIEEGRGIFAKIRAIVFFYICINLFEGLFQFVCVVFLGLPYFLGTEAFAMQWLFLSITLHALPGLVLTFDTTSKDVMKEKPRDSEEILSKNIIILMLCYGALLAISMAIVYSICITNVYGVFPDNINFGALSDGYLYTEETIDIWLLPGANPDLIKIQGKTLTMLMSTLYICETVLVLQIRRPNKSLLQSIKEDSNKRMYMILGLLYFAYLALMYIPGVQTTLARWNINFMFMYLNGLDWIICGLISLITILSFEVIKFFARRKDIYF